MNYLTLTLLLCAGIYIARLAFFVVGFVRRRKLNASRPDLPFVSVVVPARNEENNLDRCIRALANSNYPRHLLEILVVNDRSEDNTQYILDKLSVEFPIITPLHRQTLTGERNLKGKPGALQYGFDHAKGEVFLLTDADCEVHPDWIRAMATPFADIRVGMVNGFTTVRSTSFFQHVQDVEWMFAQAMARAGVNNAIPLGCFGNNMAVRSDVYKQIGGYANIPFSITEDLALLLAVTNAGYDVRYLCRSEAVVETLPCTTLTEYIAQKHRWARGGLDLGFLAGLFVASSAALWVGIIVSAIFGLWYLTIAFFLLRILGDGGLTSLPVVRLKRTNVFPYLFQALVILMFTELVVPFLVIRKRVVWKNQVFKA